MKLAPELSELVNHCKSVHFYDFAKSKEGGKCHEMSSFVESKTKKLIKEKLSEFIEYNKKQLSRIYPAGSRVDSSNYNPLMAWSAGCQIGKTESYHDTHNTHKILKNERVYWHII